MPPPECVADMCVDLLLPLLLVVFVHLYDYHISGGGSGELFQTILYTHAHARCAS